jgi:predicted esterase
MAVSINNGYVMPSWYDIFTLSSDEKQDVDGIKETSRKVHEALDEIEQNGIPSNRIILGGISQGGALAIYSALTYHKQLAGLVCLSCWLPIREELVKNCSSVNKTIPMLQCHGDADPTVRIEFGGKQTDEFLSNINPSNHQYKVYNGLRHWISPEEMDDVKKWMSNCVS